MIKYLPKYLFHKILIQYATHTTTFYVEASIFDRYIRNSEKAWVATFKWLLYKATK